MTNQEALALLQRARRKLMAIEHTVEAALQENKDMAVDPKVADLIAQFDVATDKIAARIQKLIDAGGLSADSQAALQAEVDKLNTLGQDPANPVPPV